MVFIAMPGFWMIRHRTASDPQCEFRLNRVQCDMRNFQFVFSSGEVNDISRDAV